MCLALSACRIDGCIEMNVGLVWQRNRFEAPEVRRNKARSEAAAELRVSHSEKQKVAVATDGTVDIPAGRN
jgi:hypothetical protein